MKIYYTVDLGNNFLIAISIIITRFYVSKKCFQGRRNRWGSCLTRFQRLTKLIFYGMFKRRLIFSYKILAASPRNIPFLGPWWSISVWYVITCSIISKCFCSKLQKYLRQYKHTYFILQRKYLCIYEDRFGENILRDDWTLHQLPTYTVCIVRSALNDIKEAWISAILSVY